MTRLEPLESGVYGGKINHHHHHHHDHTSVYHLIQFSDVLYWVHIQWRRLRAAGRGHVPPFLQMAGHGGFRE